MGKYSKCLALSAMALTMFSGAANAENYSLSTPKTSLVVDATKGGAFKFVYYGDKIAAADIATLQAGGTAGKDAYPVYGLIGASEAALSVRHADGNMTLQMDVADITEQMEKNAKVLKVKLKDRVYPFYVTVCYRAYNDVDIIEMWTEINNGEKTTVTLSQFDSAYLPIRRGNVWMSHFYGSWANEAQLSEEELKPGTFVVENRDGTRRCRDTQRPHFTWRGDVLARRQGSGEYRTRHRCCHLLFWQL